MPMSNRPRRHRPRSQPRRRRRRPCGQTARSAGEPGDRRPSSRLRPRCALAAGRRRLPTGRRLSTAGGRAPRCGRRRRTGGGRAPRLPRRRRLAHGLNITLVEAPEQVRHRRDRGSAGHADQQRRPEPAPAGRHGPKKPRKDKRGDETADAHRQARDGVAPLVIGRARAALCGATLQIEVLGPHRREIAGGRDHGQIHGLGPFTVAGQAITGRAIVAPSPRRGCTSHYHRPSSTTGARNVQVGARRDRWLRDRRRGCPGRR